MAALGRHLLVEYAGCDPARLSDLDRVAAAMLEAARTAGATVVAHSFHHFAAQEGGAGVSGVVIIAESHLAIHTWPEHRFAAVDFFSCGPVDMELGLAVLKAALGAREDVRLALERGPLSPVTPPG